MSPDPYHGRCPSFAYEEGRIARLAGETLDLNATEAWQNGWNDVDRPERDVGGITMIEDGAEYYFA